MPAAYPTGVKSFPTHVNTTETIDADHVNNIQLEVAALESYVGLNPHMSTNSGGSSFGAWSSAARTYLSLADRVANLEAGIVADAHSQYAQVTGETFSGDVIAPNIGALGSIGVGAGLAVVGTSLLSGGMTSFRMRPAMVAEFTNQVFTNTDWTAGTVPCQTSFSAPPSGQVLVFVLAHMTNPTSDVLCDFQVFHTSISTPNKVREADRGSAAFNQSGGQITAIGFDTVTGLAPGDTYVARTVHEVDAGTGTVFQRRLLVVPMS